MNKISLTALLLCAPIFASNFNTSGQIWFEMLTQTYQHTADGKEAPKQLRPQERWELSRVDLDFSYRASDSWSLHSRVGFNHSDNSDIRSDLAMRPLMLSNTVRVRQFYSRYDNPIWGQLNIGRISVPQISATASDQSVFGIDPNRYHVIASVSDKPGLSFEKDFGVAVWQLALWQQTSEKSISGFQLAQLPAENFSTFAAGAQIQLLLPSQSFHQRALNLGFNTALHYYPVDTPNAVIALNFGYQTRPLTQPLVIGVLAEQGDADTAQYSFSAYNALSESSLNMVSYMGRLVFEAQAQYQVLGLAHSLKYGAADQSDKLFRDLLLSDGYGVGYHATLGYHFQGGYYKLNRKSGQLVRKGSGWDVGISYGGVIAQNASALLSVLGQQDYQTKIYGGPDQEQYITGEGRVKETTLQGVQGNSYDYLAVDASYPREGFDESAPGFNQLRPGSTLAYRTHSKTYTLYLNYAYNENLIYQIELENTQRFNKLSNIINDDIVKYHSPINARSQYLRTRVFITF